MVLLLRWIVLVFSLIFHCVDSAWWQRGQRRAKHKDDDDAWPDPVLMEHFLTEQEAHTLLDRYRPLLRESLHKAHDVAGGQARRSQYRTSHTVRLPPLGDATVLSIERRAAAQLPNLTHSAVEDFQLACYGPDQLYALHRDDNAQGRANRAATVLIYLQAPQAGGTTLFTRQKIETEVGLNKQKLSTEKDAIELFRHYCDHPQPHHLVVEPATGRGVIWNNWYYDNNTPTLLFAERSTHGSCPVLRGEKCVIQQWIGRFPNSNPLRNERLAAIFTLGADLSYAQKLGQTQTDKQRDFSAREGNFIASINGKVELVQDGPYPNIGSARILGAHGIFAKLPVSDNFSLPQHDLTVSFWANNISSGTILLEINDILSIRYHQGQDDDDNNHQPHTLRLEDLNDSRFATLTFSDLDAPFPGGDWVWFSLVWHGGEAPTADLHAFSRAGRLLGSASLEMLHESVCRHLPQESTSFLALNLMVDKKKETHELLAGDRATAFVQEAVTTAFVKQQERKTQEVIGHAAVSFLVFHQAALEIDEIRNLRAEARRYDLTL